MLLITFYDEFFSFHRPVMPRLESQLIHGESKLKSKLQIKNLEEEKQCREEACSLDNFARVAKFCSLCKILQPANLAASVVDFFLYSF